MDYSQSAKPTALEKENLKEKIYYRGWLTVLRGVLIGALLAVCAVIGFGLGAFAGLTYDKPELSLASLGIEGYNTTFYDQDGNVIYTLSSAENREYASIDEMPQDLINAVIAIEDERFYEHNGIDLEGILRSGKELLGGGMQGGSTLTQQIIKKLVLNEKQNWKRKITEMYLALELEEMLREEYGKDQAKRMILEIYLNYNFLGCNCYGVQAASHYYFNKDVSELTLGESALLAGIFKAPSNYNPVTGKYEAAETRLRSVLRHMVTYGYITEEDRNYVVYEEDVFSKVSDVHEEYISKKSERINSYFVDYAIAGLTKDLKAQGYTSSEAYNKIYYGGLHVYLTENKKLQDIVDKFMENDKNFKSATWYQLDYRLTVYDKKDRNVTFNYYTIGLYKSVELAEAARDAFREKYASGLEKGQYLDSTTITTQPQSAVLLYDYKTGHVLAMGGGRGEKIANRTLNRATDSQRQPGSIFKVIASYSYAVEDGDGCGSVGDDTPFIYGGNWAPQNFDTEDVGHYGIMTYRKALARSTNIVAIRTNLLHGPSQNFKMAQKYGFTTLRAAEDAGSAGITDEVPSLAIGTGSVYLYELMSAYGSIGNGGVYIQPTYYTQVQDHDGNIILSPTQETHRVVKATTAWLLQDMMGSVMGKGDDYTGTAYAYRLSGGMAQCGKTGTTDGSADLSFVSINPYYEICIWTGYDYTTYKNIKNMKTTKMTNMRPFIYQSIMGEALKGLPVISSFAKPSGITTARVCKVSGKLATSLCANDVRGSQVIVEYYDKANVPKTYCDCHAEVEVCTATGLYPSSACYAAGCVAKQVRMIRPESILNNIEQCLDYYESIPAGKRSGYGAYTARSAYDYASVADWLYMTPECYKWLYIDTATNSVVYKLGPTVEIYDVRATHTCPYHDYLAEHGGGNGGGGEEPGGEESGGEDTPSETE